MSSISITINARQRCIIYSLLQAEGHITLGQLSKETGLTTRIIRYNLDPVRAWFKGEGHLLLTRPGFGIEINASKQERKRLLTKVSQSDEENLILTRGQRQRITLFKLLTSDGSITYQGLASNEGISRSTIIHDVTEMQKWLNGYHLTLQRTQNRGAKIIGSEGYRRYALLNLLHEELGQKKWYALWFSPNHSQQQDKSLPPTLEKYLKSLPLAYSYNTVIHLENLIGAKMALYSRAEALLYLAITINSLFQKRQVTKFIGPRPVSGVELEVSRFIFSEISRKFSIKVPEEEAWMLAAFLLAAKWEEDRIETPQEMLPILGEESVQYANVIVEHCANQLHPLLRVDQELLTSLAMHLKPVIHRIRYGLPIVNDCLEEVQRTYPEVYRSAKDGLKLIEKDLAQPIPEEEVGFIAMYLAAALNRLRTKDRTRHSVIILGDGIRAKSIFLRARLGYEFPNLDVIEVLNGLPENMDSLTRAELVLSLVSFEFPGLSIIEVSPFLNNLEKRAIRNWITDYEEKNRRQFINLDGRKPDLVDVFLPQNIIFRSSVKTWGEAVQVASQPLIDCGMILPSYTRGMIKIIEDYGPYMVIAPGSILLHARPIDGVNQVCLGVMILEEGIEFGETSGKIDIAFVLGAVDDTHHLNVLYQLTALVYEEGFMEALRNSKRPADVLRAVWNFSNTPAVVSR